MLAAVRKARPSADRMAFSSPNLFNDSSDESLNGAPDSPAACNSRSQRRSRAVRLPQ